MVADGCFLLELEGPSAIEHERKAVIFDKAHGHFPSNNNCISS